MKRRGFFQQVLAAWLGVQVVVESNVINEVTPGPATQYMRDPNMTYGIGPPNQGANDDEIFSVSDKVTLLHNHHLERGQLVDCDC